MSNQHQEMALETMLVHHGEEREKQNGAVVPPIYQNSLFTFESWDAIDDAFSDPINSSIYTRGNNPSATVLEAKIAKMAGGEKARLMSSGMSAITAAIMHCVKAGDHIVTLKNIYGPAMNFISNYLDKKLNISSTFVSGCDLQELENAIQDNTTVIYLESPTSATFTLQDLNAIAHIARQRGIKTIIDNTWATPMFQKPLALGIDIEVHSCSKYLGGHSDVVAGVIIGSAVDLDSIFSNEYALFGSKIAPFEAWLLTRSIRTLPLRIKQHQESALKVAQFLEDHPKVKSVSYPGLPSHPQYELACQQMTGFTGLFTFEVNTTSIPEMKAFLNSLEFFSIGVSWGGHESLAYVTAISYLKEMTPEQFKASGLSFGMVRLSIGLEDVDDLIADLSGSLECITT
ncbi:aminotransferase class I/II-fold pyridoxal phosphate-dependent enzyme [Vibrio sp.]|nr:aminotransferase class I/II-fold pyridoxal phosphate-dependent enzyme [Vibrio sp.]